MRSSHNPGIQDGSFVSVEGDFLSTLIATKLELDTPSPAADPGWDMELEGVITLAPPDTPAGEFEINGLSVMTSGQTTFTGGTIADIAIINIRVTARGTVDNNGTLAAGNVEFH